MANDIFTIRHDTTGANLYALIRDRDGKVADVAVDQAFETFADASLGDYDLAGAEQGTASQCYAFTFPAWIAAGTYTVHVYERAGGSPAVTDDLVGQGSIEWDGSEIVTLTSRAASGDQMDLVDAPNATARTAIGATLEAMILDEGDATALLSAIAAKIEEFLINEGDATATIAAIATACNAAVEAGQVGTDAGAAAAQTTANAIRAALVDDDTRIDASALNTASAAIGSNGSGLTEAGGTGGHLTEIPDMATATNQAVIAGYIDTEISAIKAVTDQLTFDGSNLQVQVVDLTATALAKFATDDTGETTAADGSVAKIAQGAAGGNVTVGDITPAALAKFATEDTGEASAAAGSVAKLSQASTLSLTVPAASIAAVQAGETLTLQRGDKLELSFTDLALDDTSVLIFALKARLSHVDSRAWILVRSDTGLSRIAAATPSDAGNGELTYDIGAGTADVTIEAVEMAKLDAGSDLYWAIEKITSGGSVVTLTKGRATVEGDVVRAVE